MKSRKIVLITGATSGIGRACAEKFAANGYDLIITGRRQERLDELTARLNSVHGIDCVPLCFDVRDKKEVVKWLNGRAARWKPVDLLINNAGLALGRDTFDQANEDDWETMIDTNIKGLLYVTRAILPEMIAAGQGQIINLGSTAAKEVYDRGNVYCATKTAVEALSKAMRIDLLPHRIRVTAIHPGATETEFSLVRFKQDAVQAGKVYEGFEPLHPEDVADTIFYCAGLPPHVCINDLTMTCTAQANSYYFFKQ